MIKINVVVLISHNDNAVVLRPALIYEIIESCMTTSPIRHQTQFVEPFLMCILLQLNPAPLKMLLFLT